MGRALTVCSVPGCPELTQGGRCARHRAAAERRRGSAHRRGYGGPGWEAARRAVLARDPLCVCEEPCHGHAGRCGAPSGVADHWPVERKDLVAAGVPDPDAPERMRGVCKPCHDRSTPGRTPGGWNAYPTG